MKKWKVIAIIIASIIIAAFVGSYVFALGIFLMKIVFGLVAIIIFILGILVGRFFLYKTKKKDEESYNS